MSSISGKHNNNIYVISLDFNAKSNVLGMSCEVIRP